MKGSISKVLGVLVVVASFVAAPSTWAKEDLDCGTVVKGVISEIVYTDNAIIVSTASDLVTVQGIPLSYLEKWGTVDLVQFKDDGTEITISAHECPLWSTLMACDLSYDADPDPAVEEIITIDFRQGTLGQNGKDK